MKFRKIISLSVLTSFFFVALTGIILYITPQGRVAYWADWRLLGLTKDEWTAIHINLSLLFLIGSGFHIYYNWNPLIAYLKNKAKQLVVFNREFSLALAVTLIAVLGTYFSIPPFQTVISINDKIKAGHEKTYGSPPYGHAELSSLQSFCKKMGLDAEKALQILVQKKISGADKNKTLKAIAGDNGISPQQVYLMIADAKSEAPKDAGNTPGQIIPTGLGKKTLAQAAEEYHLDLKKGIENLAAQNIEASPEMTFMEIARAEDLSPIDIFEMMKK
jgi:hypothetical protein